MLNSPVRRDARNRRSILVFFLLGAAAGGFVTATGLFFASGLFQPISAPNRRFLLISLVGIALVLKALGLLRWLPQTTRQIPMSVFDRDSRLASFRFAFELGTGVRTYLSALGPYVVACALVLLHPGFATSLVVGSGFGVGRWATFLLGPGHLAANYTDDSSRLRLRMATSVMSALSIVGIVVLSL